MNKMRKFVVVLMIVIVLLVVFIVAVILFKKSHYVSDYYDVIGISERGSLRKTYEELVNEIGEPISEVDLEKNKKELIYDGFKVIMSTMTTSNRMAYVVIFDSRITFGNKQIGVGSTRKEVENAYFLRGHELEFDVYDLTYAEGLNGIGFIFDENDCVEEITLFTTELYY
jgi:hypothetical protein